MIMDLTTLFSNAQPITASAASTNIIDLGNLGTPYGAAQLKRDIGKGAMLPLTLNVVQSFNNLTSLTVTIQKATDAAFTTPLTAYTSPAYPLADLQVNARYLLPDAIPVGVDLRFVRMFYTVAGTAPTLGQITAGISMGDQTSFQ